MLKSGALYRHADWEVYVQQLLSKQGPIDLWQLQNMVLQNPE